MLATFSHIARALVGLNLNRWLVVFSPLVGWAKIQPLVGLKFKPKPQTQNHARDMFRSGIFLLSQVITDKRVEDTMEKSFLINPTIEMIICGLLCHLFLRAIGSFIGGFIVRHKGIKTNYTRKINHLILFALPMAFFSLYTYEESLMTAVFSFPIGFVDLTIYIKPIRERIGIIQTAFLSFDRPEDRPHTLLWLSTQRVASYSVLIPLLIYLNSVGKMSLLYIPVLINGIGDGLAEPVGVRFGKHTYKAYALFSKKKYVRSIEGSACVFITSIITVLALHSSFCPNQFIAALIGIPIVMTLAEAIAPHSWDSPFLYAVSGLAVFGILQI